MIVRPTLRFPDREAAPAALVRMADRTQAQADSAYGAALENPALDDSWFATIAWEEYRRELAHPLSAVWRGQGPRREQRRDGMAEFHAFLSARTLLIDALDSPSAERFVQSLCEAAALLCPDVGGRLRDAPAGLIPDGNGIRVEFGPATEVRVRLAMLHAEYRACLWPPAVRALAAMAVLLNIHPFADGNGRCARALFNAALCLDPRRPVQRDGFGGAPTQTDVRCAYIPLRGALLVSDAGYEIRLREAETNANWSPLFGYFRAVFAAMADAHAGSSGQSRASV